MEKNYWAKLQRERISRRRLLGAAGIGAAGLAIAAACGDSGGDDEPSVSGTPTAALGTPTRGGRYIYATQGDWGGFDPVTSVAFGPGIFPRIYNVLVEQGRVNSDFVFPDLAESLPEQPDEETYIYTIRPGVKIGPNSLDIPERDMDSSDAESWLTRVQQEPNAVHSAFTSQWLQSFEAADAQTFQIKTNGPYAYMLLRLGAPLGGCMPPKEFFEQEISLEADGVGAGPYTIQAGTFTEDGSVVLERNPNYYRLDDRTGEQLPYADEIQAVRVDDRQARRTSFIDGQISAYGAETAAEVEDIRGSVPGVKVFENPANTYIAFNMNPTKAPWDDARVRKAAMFALNRQEYVDLIVGPDGGKPNGLVHWSLESYALDPSELEQLQPFDPEMSRQLLTDAGHDLPLSIKVMYPVSDIQFHDQHLPIWRQQMEAAGFALDEDALDFGTWLDRYTNVDYDSSLSLNQVYETAEVPLDWHSSQGPQGDGNFGIGIGELLPDIEAAISASKAVTNFEEQAALVKETQRMIYEAGPGFLPIMTWNAFTLRQPSVENWATGIGASNLYLTDWWLEPEA